jgi:homotetrameric cytidine deaminase
MSRNVDPAALAELVAAAQRVRVHAHAPYSKFAVGAAVLDEQGRIHAGCNVENAAYPQGWCAEASALSVMVASGGKTVLAVAVCGDAPQPVTPCGGCRRLPGADRRQERPARDAPPGRSAAVQLRAAVPEALTVPLPEAHSP